MSCSAHIGTGQSGAAALGAGTLGSCRWLARSWRSERAKGTSMRESCRRDVIALAIFLALREIACGGTVAGPAHEREGGDGTAPNEAGAEEGGGDSNDDATLDGSTPSEGGGDSNDDATLDGSTPSEGGGDEPGDADSAPLSPSRFPCVNPTRVLLGDADTGFDTCQGAAVFAWGATAGVRRRAALACPSFLPRPSSGACP